ncbi:hypothetical protein HMPREF0620_0479 [Parascardovia denticolens DSM 10105 = JCM 12538]|uniref:Uncharacterized protein n=1 Tax=Parascardovia denticolens DSM 10105 = JCM 12538 TaxID=864564 RepID=E6K0Z3_PARDN|nr:hypothetical protein [Parascardovia denticolens]EFG33090.1 hypothetical protein HMPREF9017_00499 [Parascardovia denticolens F0305]EFT83474.1 hypothetical protein HMPREF0620_0479 [Parascardovia denticolens DSM 10105 = JCM 12538]BAR05638.1 hypothetical protein PSDT_1119 [Parascardovia denticolens DSM 10105 = JCM 12538]
MTHYLLRVPTSPSQGSKPISLYVYDSTVGSDSPAALLHTYPPQEQYPLGADRFLKDRPNVFLDVADLLEGNRLTVEDFADFPQDWQDSADSGDSREPQDSQKASLSGEMTVVHLSALCQYASRRSADGSGNARRFKDARDLWTRLRKLVLDRIVTPQATPIVKVRKASNWKKNQAFKDVTCDPRAWYVSRVFGRSNSRKDAFVAYRGWEALARDLGGSSTMPAAPVLAAGGPSAKTMGGDAPTVSSALSSAVTAAKENLDYPTFGEIAAFLDDSNMVVFHDDASFAALIRDNAGKGKEIFPDTPVEVHTVPDPQMDPDDPAFLPESSTMGANHFANVIAPRS